MARKPVAAFEEIIIRLQIGMIDPVANRVSLETIQAHHVRAPLAPNVIKSSFSEFIFVWDREIRRIISQRLAADCQAGEN
jgi:hypothetical protein